MAEAPTRACVLIAKIDADTPDDMVSHLRNLACRIERGDLTGPVSISGGYSSGHIVHYVANSEPSHDVWAEKLNAYVESLRKQVEVPEVSGG